MHLFQIPDGNRDELAECLLPQLGRNDIRYFELGRSWQELPRTSGPEALVGPGYAVVVVQFDSRDRLVNWSLLEGRDAFHWLCVYGFPIHEPHVAPAAQCFAPGADRQTALNAFGFATQAPRTQRSATDNPDGTRTLIYAHNLDAWLQIDVDAQDRILRYAWLSGAQVMAHFRRPQGAKKPEEVAEKVDLDKIVAALRAFDNPQRERVSAQAATPAEAPTLSLAEVLAARRAQVEAPAAPEGSTRVDRAPSVAENPPAAIARPPAPGSAPSASASRTTTASTPSFPALSLHPLPPIPLAKEVGILVLGTVAVLGLSVLVAVFTTLGVGIGVMCGVGIPAALLAPKFTARRRARRQRLTTPLTLAGGVLSVPAHAKAPAAQIDLRVPLVAATHFLFRGGSTGTNTSAHSRATLQIRQGDTVVTLYTDEFVPPKVAHSYRFGDNPAAPPLLGDGHELTFDDLMTLWKVIRPPG